MSGRRDELSHVLGKLQNSPGQMSEYRIPLCWNTCRAEGKTHGESEIAVDPHMFFSQCIELALQQKQGSHRGWRGTEEVVYSMLARAQTAWNHSGQGIQGGTFLKAIALLPVLKSMRVSIIYLLPVFEPCWQYRKGGLPSPYAVRDFYRLDPGLHDPLLGEYSHETLEIQFAAFVQAAHAYGMKVMLDFPLRSCGRENELMREHPDWFYWIRLDAAARFGPPHIDDFKKQTNLTRRNAHTVYAQAGLGDFLGCFCADPRSLDQALWERVKRSGNLLETIEREFGVTSAPAFSDCVNDAQPPWTDATFLRYDLGQNAMARRYAPPGQLPYVLFDTIKLNTFAAGQRNAGLWEYIENIIPHYQRAFGIDGARVDMGHALPPRLNKRIVNLARGNDPYFIFWSEVFDSGRSKQAKEDGFQFISGAVWNSDRSSGGYNKKLFAELQRNALPPLAALEMADTPRISAAVPDGGKLAALVVYTALLPNTVGFINSGQELLETQPMNLGLGESGKGRYSLPESDPMNGKLAFFDVYRLHWTAGRNGMPGLIAGAMKLRAKHARLIGDPSAFHMDEKARREKFLTAFYYSRGRGGLFVAYNRGEIRVKIEGFLPQASMLRTVFAGGQFCGGSVNKAELELGGGAAIVLEFDGGK